MEEFPAVLPAPMQDKYSINPGEAVTRTEMESGPARQRREFTQVPTKIPVRWKFRQDQLALFQAWYRWKADEGGEWFTIDLLSGLGLVPHEARFVGQYKAPKRTEGGFFVDAELEVRELPVLTEPELDILLDTDLVDLQAAVARLHVLSNQTLFILLGAS